jgi:transposase-like protein
VVPGASVSAIALEHCINANLLFAWRRAHLRAMAVTRPAVLVTPMVRHRRRAAQ